MNKLLFLQTFLKSPAQVGSVIPSSKFMIDKVVKRASMNNPASIVELGAGTGVVTRELQKLNTKLLVFEKDDTMRQHLDTEFIDEEDTFIYADAYHLRASMRDQQLDKLDCVICGLPLTLFPPEKREELLQLVYDNLKDDGEFILYGYTLHMKKSLNNLYSNVQTSFIPLNVPPTFVYHCMK